MLSAQWGLLFLMGFRLALILLMQGKELKDRPNGWNVLFWFLTAGLLFAAGAFNQVFGIP
jgi:hypothetical protein